MYIKINYTPKIIMFLSYNEWTFFTKNYIV